MRSLNGAAVVLILAAAGCGFTNYPGVTDAGGMSTGSGSGGTQNPSSENPSAATYSQVGPILRSKCSGCHSSGAVNFTAYSGFARNTSLIIPGNPEQSRLYIITQSGTMPPGGNDLSSTQQSLLYSWIEAGALNN